MKAVDDWNFSRSPFDNGYFVSPRFFQWFRVRAFSGFDCTAGVHSHFWGNYYFLPRHPRDHEREFL